MDLTTLEGRFDKIIASYSENAGKAIDYCTPDNGEAFKAMRVASENAIRDIKFLVLQYLQELS